MKVWVGNLGKYNEGDLVGDWINLPVTKNELNEFLRNTVGLQLTEQEVNEALKKDGVCYEEYMICDIETELTCYDLYEYENIDNLNLLAAYEEKANNINAINAYCKNQNISSIEKICNIIEQEDELHFYETSYDAHLSDEEAVAYWDIDEIYGEIPNSLLEQYFDYEAFGRDLSIDYSGGYDGLPETAEEYYCGNENATDTEIGYQYVDDNGFDCISNKEQYFDYEQYGRTLLMDNFTVVTNGYGHQEILDCCDTINETFYTKQELIDNVDDVIEYNELTQQEPEMEICE